MPFSSSNAPYPASQPLPSGNAFSVLVVEDQGSVRAALVAELRRAGVSDIFEAPEGNAALHLFKTHRPDLVLLDIR
ncbi:MAG: response regulator, partial [Betaproteobacteria bacterium]